MGNVYNSEHVVAILLSPNRTDVKMDSNTTY